MEDKWADQVARMGELNISYRVLVGQPERKRITGRYNGKSFGFLECHVALIGSYLCTFRNNLSAPFSLVKQSKKNITCGNSIVIKLAETE